MKTVKSSSEFSIDIKNSRFITILFNFYDDSNIDTYLENVKKRYPKATHYCFAYVTDSYQKANDDGEPGGTAGMPMLNVLLKEEMINVLAITVRYFGGIKLGAGGLVRAYSKSVKDAILNACIVPIEMGNLVKIDFSYSNQKEMDYSLKQYNIVKKEFNEMVSYYVLIPDRNMNIISNYNHQIIKRQYIEKVL